MPRMRSGRTLELAVVGTAGGLFSGLFGVGGGVILVPLLVLWLGWGERRATATSLGAIVVIAAVGSVTNGLLGHVHVDDAALVGLPAVAGVLAGTWLQQHMRAEWISILFATMLIVVAAELALR